MPTNLSEQQKILQKMEMGLGAWAWGDKTIWNYGHGYGEKDIAEAFQASVNAGINLVDTAEVYGSGQSELFTGNFIKKYGKPVYIATKFMPYPWRLSRRALARSLDASLDRLQMDVVDLYQIHWPFAPMPVEFWVKELALAVKSGKARAAGVSNYSKAEMLRACAILEAHDLPLASNQVQYHILDRTVEKNGLVNICREKGIRLIAYSPLAKGLLTGKYTVNAPPPGIRGIRYTTARLESLTSLIQLMREVGQGHGGKLPSQVALNWVICKGALPIPGAKNRAQAEENAGAVGWRLTPEEVSALDEAGDRLA